MLLDAAAFALVAGAMCVFLRWPLLVNIYPFNVRVSRSLRLRSAKWIALVDFVCNMMFVAPLAKVALFMVWNSDSALAVATRCLDTFTVYCFYLSMSLQVYAMEQIVQRARAHATRAAGPGGQ